MMDESQEDSLRNSEKGQRPLILGSLLLGVALSCFIYVNPTLMISEMGVSEAKVNHLLALICVLAALASPALAFMNRALMMAISIPIFVAFLTLNHFNMAPLAMTYAAFGPFLAFIQWGPLLLCKKATLAWHQAASGWPHLIVALVLQSKAKAEPLCLAVNVLSLALAGLCQIVYMCCNTEEKAEVKNLESKRPKVVAPLRLYLKDNRVHMLLPLAFFIGLFEAFMARHFILVSSESHLFFHYPFFDNLAKILSKEDIITGFNFEFWRQSTIHKQFRRENLNLNFLLLFPH